MRKYILSIVITFLLLILQNQLSAQSEKTPGVKDKDGNEKVIREENPANENHEEMTYTQPFRQELFEIIKLFLLEEGSSESTLDWQTGNEINSITWNQIRTYNEIDMKEGSFKIEGGDWDIALTGQSGANGANCVSFGFGFASYGIGGGEIDCSESLELLFWLPDQNYQYDLIKKHECYVSEGSALYKIKFSGKKTVWAWTSYSSGSRSGATNIGLYFDKEEAFKVDDY